jgi:hypothetical protein
MAMSTMSFASGPAMKTSSASIRHARLARLNGCLPRLGNATDCCPQRRQSRFTFLSKASPWPQRLLSFFLQLKENEMAATPEAKQSSSESRKPADRDIDVRRSVSLGRLRMRLNLSIGRLLTLSAPLLSVVALYFSFSWFGIFRIVPDWVRLLLLGPVCGLGCRWYPCGRSLRLRAPGRAEDRHAAGSRKPDRQPGDFEPGRQDRRRTNPVARALWLEHRRRMASKIGALSKPAFPRSSLPQRDPLGHARCCRLCCCSSRSSTPIPDKAGRPVRRLRQSRPANGDCPMSGLMPG